MATKSKRLYTCQSCGSVSPKWLGQCPACQEWNTFAEESVITDTRSHVSSQAKKPPVSIVDIPVTKDMVIPSEHRELDRVLGSGFVRGAVHLLGGEPGIGKSTLALQVAQSFAQKGFNVLYISGEESESQLVKRSSRLGKNTSSLFILSEVNLSHIIAAIESLSPHLVIIDSIQVLYDPNLTASSGTASQIRHCANALIQLMKSIQCIGIIIGHITKDGAIAGPKILEHLVDVILYFEGDNHYHYRLLRCLKNRFAPAHEIGLFTMDQSGLNEALSPSELFIEGSSHVPNGTAITATLEGSRAILGEVQSLVVTSGYGMAKRSFLGVDSNRATLIIAAMEKLLDIKLSNLDIFITVIGGLKIKEPVQDLAILISIYSSLMNRPFDRQTGVLGEISLTGEIRAVNQLEKRIREFEAMGFKSCILPKRNQKQFPKKTSIRPLYVETVHDAIKIT